MSSKVVIGAASPQVYLYLWVCVGDVQQDRLLSVLSVRSVPKISSPDDVHPQVPVCSEGFTALHLVWNSESLQRARDRVEKWLVLVHLRPGSGTDACVPGVHVDCTAAGAPLCYVLLKPYEASSNVHELCCRYDTERLCWPRPKAFRGSCSLYAPIASLGKEALVSPPSSGSSGPGVRAVSGSCSSKAVWAACLFPG